MLVNFYNLSFTFKTSAVTVRVNLNVPYGEVEQVLASGCFKVLDGADSVETLLKEELS